MNLTSVFLDVEFLIPFLGCKSNHHEEDDMGDVCVDLIVAGNCADPP
jgi:hypothetical protein